MGAPECDNLTLGEHHIVARGRISSPSFLFIFYAKFPKSTDQDILALFQCTFDLFQQNLYKFGGSVFGKSEIIVNGIYDIGFCQCH